MNALQEIALWAKSHSVLLIGAAVLVVFIACGALIPPSVRHWALAGFAVVSLAAAIGLAVYTRIHEYEEFDFTGVVLVAGAGVLVVVAIIAAVWAWTIW